MQHITLWLEVVLSGNSKEAKTQSVQKVQFNGDTAIIVFNHLNPRIYFVDWGL